MRRIPTRNSKTRKLCEFLYTFGPKTPSELTAYFDTIGGSSKVSPTSLLSGTEYAEKVNGVYVLADYLTKYFAGCETRTTTVGPIVQPAYRPAFKEWTGKHDFTNDRIDKSRSYMTSGVQFCERP